MVIYGNNLHEKLQGVAISREYLKYNTPFCDLVDDPDWQTDINLALDYNSALNGNLDAADKVVQVLTIASNALDNSTVEWYLHKITNNPVFRSAIDNMRSRWANPADWSDEFQFDFNQALNDCLNSPCNLFTETSDSIGRMAQAASTKTSDNTFGVGALSGSFINMIDGLDQTIFNKIPAIFQDGFTEVAQVANKAFTNTQAVLAGKENLATFNDRVNNGQSFRSPSEVFRYTPDVKSYYDYSAASSNVLSKIKEDIGGCFSRFEFKYRYNPYENNMSRPIGTRTLHVNGRDYDVDAVGTADRSPNNSLRLSKQTSVGPNIIVPSGVNSVGESYMDDDARISSIFNLDARSKKTHNHYSVFASLIDTDTKTLWYEDYDKTANDVLTLQGTSNIGSNYRIGVSVQGTNNDFIARALNQESITDRELQRYGASTQAGTYAAGFKHILTDEGMETLYHTPNTQIINDGVAVSKGLFRAFMNDPKLWHGSASYVKPQRANEYFIAARPAGKTTWKFYKVCDSNGQTNLNVDFTMGAYKHFLKSYNLGDLTAASTGVARRRPIANTDWSRVLKVFQKNIGTMEVRVCQGNIENIKARLSKLENTQSLDSINNNIGFRVDNDPYSQSSIDNGSLDNIDFQTKNDPDSQSSIDAGSLGQSDESKVSTLISDSDGIRVTNVATESDVTTVSEPRTYTKVLPDGTIATYTTVETKQVQSRFKETVTEYD